MMKSAQSSARTMTKNEVMASLFAASNQPTGSSAPSRSARRQQERGAQRDAVELSRSLRRIKRKLFLEYVNGTLPPQLQEPEFFTDVEESLPQIPETKVPSIQKPGLRKDSYDSTYSCAATVDTFLSDSESSMFWESENEM